LQQFAELCIPIGRRYIDLDGQPRGCSALQHPEPNPADDARRRAQRIVQALQEARRLAGLS
jgi:hypothetical protein